jgi:diguanylate cyclase (GGDEF)-like protein
VVTVLAGPVELTGDQFRSGIYRHQLHTTVPPPATVEEFSRQVRLGRALRHSVLFPLKTPELYLGLVYLAGDDPELADPRVRELVQVVCDALALTLQNTLLREQLARTNAQLSEQARTLEDILEIGTEITFKQEVDAILQRIASAIRDALGFRVVAVSLREPEASIFRRRAHAGGEPRGETLQAGPLPEAVVYRLWTEDHRVSKSFMVKRLLQAAAEGPPRDGRRDSGTWHPTSVLHVPLKAEGQVMGYIAAEDPADQRTPSYERIRVLEIFASQAVAAVQAYRAYEQVRQLSIQDPMTGAYNFRHLQEVIARELRRHVRTGNPFHLAILDLDNFKDVNDRFGHPAGDQVLQGLVALLRAQVRAEVDLVFRYGGDELAILFPELAADAARAVLERIRAAVAAHAFRFEIDGGYREFRLTVSVGCAGFPAQATERAGLIGAADRALLQAKAAGKDRVVGAGELLAAESPSI